MKYDKYHHTCSIHLLPGGMLPAPLPPLSRRWRGNLHHLHLRTFLFFTIKEKTISYPITNVHVYYDSGKLTTLYFYSPTEHNWVPLYKHRRNKKIILSKLSKVIYMTNQNTHEMRHIFSNVQSGFLLFSPTKERTEN